MFRSACGASIRATARRQNPLEPMISCHRTVTGEFSRRAPLRSVSNFGSSMSKMAKLESSLEAVKKS